MMLATRRRSTVVAVLLVLVLVAVLPACVSSGSHAAAPAVVTGAGRLAQDPTLRASTLAGRTGIISNPTGILPNLTHIVDFLAAAPDVDLVSIYGPEHGFRGDHQAGHGSADMYIDNQTHLPVYSLYQKTGQELADVLDKENLTTLVYDIQDVGCRFYTYIWTLWDVMEALPLMKNAISTLVVLDRPNPINATIVQGPVLEPAFASFVGRYSIPLRHGMTTAELSTLFYAVQNLASTTKVKLTPLKMLNYNRASLFTTTGLPWVPPSPNMPTINTALVYPGIGIIEGTNLSEGRGTTTPFNLFGAGFFNYTFTQSLQNAVAAASHTTESAYLTGTQRSDEDRAEKGAALFQGGAVREAYFVPTFSKFMGNVTTGCELFVLDAGTFNPLAWGLLVVAEALRQYPESTVISGPDFDVHLGNNSTRIALENGTSVPNLVAAWQADLNAFKKIRKNYLLYQ